MKGLGSPVKEDATSHTGRMSSPSSRGGGMNAANLADFDLPRWEHPGLKEEELPAKPKSVPATTTEIASPSAAQKRRQSKMEPEQIEDIVLTFSDSCSQLSDDLTLCSDIQEKPPRVGTSSRVAPGTASREQRVARTKQLPTTKRSDNNSDALAAQQAQEEEMIQIALERSMADLGEDSLADLNETTPCTRQSPRRKVSMGSSMQDMRLSPQRNFSSSSISMRDLTVSPHSKASNNSSSMRDMMSSQRRLPPRTSSSSTKRSMSVRDLSRRAGTRSATNSVVSGGSSLGAYSGRVQTDAKTGCQFVWEKGPNNRYMKVPVNMEATVSRAPPQRRAPQRRASYNGEALSAGRSDGLSREETLERMEQKMLEEAMNRSMADSARMSLPASPRKEKYMTEEERREQELIELAMERSLQESLPRSQRGASARESAGSGVSRRPSLGYFGGTNAVPSNNNMNGRLSKDVGQGANTPDFIWKKGPNNSYYKCPIGLDQVNEGEVYRDNTIPDERGDTRDAERLERMEHDMIKEAMERSMADIHS